MFMNPDVGAAMLPFEKNKNIKNIDRNIVNGIKR